MSDEDDNTMSLNEEKFPNQNVSYPQNDGKSYIDLEEDDDDDDDDGGDGVLRIGIDDYGGGGDTTDDDDDESGDPQRHPKKRKLKTLLSSYEFARRLPASPSPPVPKPSYGGRNPLLDWTERETSVLLDAWGERYLKRGRKSLRSEEWQEVSEKVSQGSQIERTDTQCRNRLDTLKKKYKKEKAKLGENTGSVACKWIYFNKMDGLLSSPTQQAGLSSGMDVFASPKAYLNQPNGVNETRDSPVDSGGDGEGESEGLPLKRGSNGVFKMLADSIHKFSEIYQKIELSKRQQMVELEKMRMDFHRDMDLQKRKILERAQADIEKIWNGDDEDNDASPENVSG